MPSGPQLANSPIEQAFYSKKYSFQVWVGFKIHRFGSDESDEKSSGRFYFFISNLIINLRITIFSPIIYSNNKNSFYLFFSALRQPLPLRKKTGKRIARTPARRPAQAFFRDCPETRCRQKDAPPGRTVPPRTGLPLQKRGRMRGSYPPHAAPKAFTGQQRPYSTMLIIRPGTTTTRLTVSPLRAAARRSSARMAAST